MDLNFNICQLDINEKKYFIDDFGIKLIYVINLGENVYVIGIQNGKKEFGSLEYVCLFIVFEGKIIYERKVF